MITTNVPNVFIFASDASFDIWPTGNRIISLNFICPWDKSLDINNNVDNRTSSPLNWSKDSVCAVLTLLFKIVFVY